MNKKEHFIQTIQENQGLIRKVAAFYTDGEADQEDLVQEIVYHLWKSFDTFGERSAITTWMYRVAMNVSIHHLKKSKKRVATIPMNQKAMNVGAAYAPDEEEQWLELKTHINNLNMLDKGILMLYLEDKPHEEIAQIIGISRSNVGTRLSRIREKLKKEVSK